MHNPISKDFNRYERVISSVPWISKSVQESFAQVSRSTRLSNQLPNQHQQVIWATSTNVIGPLYTAFVWWILKKAQTDGVRRLYFMARDGLVLKDIAEQIIQKAGWDIECRYLNVSRQSLLYASVTDIDTFDIRWFMWNPLTPLSAEKILERLEILPESVQEELSRIQITDINKNLSLFEKLRFRNIFNEPRVKSLILEKAKPRHETTMAYLRQEGLSDNISFALVDLGWLALSQYALSRILDKNNCRPNAGVKGYYLGTNWLLWKYKNDSTDSFMFDPQNMLWRMPVVQYELPEIFATADSGRTLGYQRQGDRITPVLGQVNTKALEWGSELQKNGVITFARNIVTALPTETWGQETPNAEIRKIFDLFCNTPSPDEAEVYGKFVHGADIEEKQGHPIAPVVKLKDIPKLLTGYYWVQGSVKRSCGLTNLFINLICIIINSLRHLILSFIGKIFFPREKVNHAKQFS